MIKFDAKERVITGLILISLTVGAVTLLNERVFTIVLAIVAIVASWEWCKLSSPTHLDLWDGIFLVLIGSSLLVLLQFPQILPWVFGCSIIWWGGIAVILLYSRIRLQEPKLRARRWHAFAIIVPAAVALSTLHDVFPEGRWYLMAFLLIIWTADTTAYFVGRAYGRKLLAPFISPAKTIEGAVGGVVGAVVMGLILYEFLPFVSNVTRWNWYLLVCCAAGLSIIGDLYESACKRFVGVKDSGSILPGHGGVLDRLDSVFASSPIFVAGLLYFSR